MSTWVHAQGVKECPTGTGYQFKLTYEANDQWAVRRPPTPTRITDRDRVEVCVQHFNYLRFVLKFSVEEQKVESYSYLTKLWGSILNPSLAGVLSTPEIATAPDRETPEQRVRRELITKLQRLYGASRELDGAVAAAAKPYVNTGLTAAQAADLSTARGVETDTPQRGVLGSRTVARNAFKDVDEYIMKEPYAFAAIYGELQAMYRAVLDHYHAVDDRTQIFLRLSAKTIAFEVKRVGKRDAGTRVTFTVAAADDSGATTPVNEVSYFVQSNMPLVVHGGVSFAGLNDVSFTKVRRSTTFGEEELFQRTTNADSSTALFSLFLGWQFFGTHNDVEDDARKGKVGAAFSLGTDIRDPGKRVFAGPSLILFNRLVLSGGVVFGSESEGESATFEPNVFRIIRAKPKASYFFSLSTKVY
jgi:hypothetical protein